MFHQFPYASHTPIPADLGELDQVKRPENVPGYMRIILGESAEFVSIEVDSGFTQSRQEIASAAARVSLNGQLEITV